METNHSHDSHGDSHSPSSSRNDGSPSHNRGDESGASGGSGSLGSINLSEIFVFSADPSSRPRGSLTALVHRGQTHPVSRGMPKKKRNKCTNEQLEALEEFFATNRNPTGRIREELSKRIRMPERSVQVWFQNKRAKIKTGDPKPDAEILAEFADAKDTSPITQLALAGVAARNKQIQLPIPAPAPAPATHKTAEALPAFSLTIGTWRRLNPTLVIFFALKLQTFVSYVRSDSLGYKLDIPLRSITRLSFTGPDNPNQVEQEEGLDEPVGRFTIEVNHAPTFFMEVFRSGRDGDANNKPSWRQCSDFTQDRQATQETTHYICGPYTELKRALASVLSASDTVRSRMSPDTIDRILGPEQPPQMSISSQPNVTTGPYILPDQTSNYLSYPSGSMSNVAYSSHNPYGPNLNASSAYQEGGSNDTVVARNAWRFHPSSMQAPAYPSQSHSHQQQQQQQLAFSSGQVGDAFGWYGSPNTASTSAVAPPAAAAAAAAASSSDSYSQGHLAVSQVQQMGTMPMSLQGGGRAGPMSMQGGSSTFPTGSYSFTSEASGSVYEFPQPTRDLGGANPSRSTFYETAPGTGITESMSSRAVDVSGGHSGTTSNGTPSSLGGVHTAASSSLGTPHTAATSLSGSASESSKGFTNHFANSFVGLGLDLDVSAQSTAAGNLGSSGQQDLLAQSHPPTGTAVAYGAPTGQVYYDGAHAQTSYGTRQAHSASGGSQNVSVSGPAAVDFVMPPRMAWSQETSGAHVQQSLGSQQYGMQTQVADYRAEDQNEDVDERCHGENGAEAPYRRGSSVRLGTSASGTASFGDVHPSSLPAEQEEDGGYPRVSKTSNGSSVGTVLPPYPSGVQQAGAAHATA
ncbi:hypothetical protein OC845_000701 [Tilletia horrida]|nr:hypothetical protein OC845_000701 [Tilletia horrida]